MRLLLVGTVAYISLFVLRVFVSPVANLAVVHEPDDDIHLPGLLGSVLYAR